MTPDSRCSCCHVASLPFVVFLAANQSLLSAAHLRPSRKCECPPTVLPHSPYPLRWMSIPSPRPGRLCQQPYLPRCPPERHIRNRRQSPARRPAASPGCRFVPLRPLFPAPRARPASASPPASAARPGARSTPPSGCPAPQPQPLRPEQARRECCHHSRLPAHLPSPEPDPGTPPRLDARRHESSSAREPKNPRPTR